MLAKKRETSGIRRKNKIIDGSYLDDPEHNSPPKKNQNDSIAYDD